ncbi:MAG: hypothetical protein IJB59_02205 [Oscillospiraceae bacterium]|nr:hypothetical protein [Oscillospiraceae bacterium]
MKKPITILLVLFAAALLLTTGHRDRRTQEISEILGIDVTGALLSEDRDSHGGFHGDGLRFVVLSELPPTVATEISHAKGWREFPLTENMTALLYGLDRGQWKYGPYLQENSQPLFPEIKEGWWYFYNRKTETYDDAGVLDAGSFNFTAAVYDPATQVIYYAVFDT